MEPAKEGTGERGTAEAEEERRGENLKNNEGRGRVNKQRKTVSGMKRGAAERRDELSPTMAPPKTWPAGRLSPTTNQPKSAIQKLQSNKTYLLLTADRAALESIFVFGRRP